MIVVFSSAFSLSSGSGVRALLPKADITQRGGNVRFVPKPDSCTAAIETIVRVQPPFHLDESRSRSRPAIERATAVNRQRQDRRDGDRH